MRLVICEVCFCEIVILERMPLKDKPDLKCAICGHLLIPPRKDN